MHRFFSPTLVPAGEIIDLPEEAAGQCSRVLRLKRGEKLALFDGSGAEAVVELVDAGPVNTRGRVLSVEFPERSSRRRVELLAAIPRAERWEWILQKGTELGVLLFQPLRTVRSVVVLDDVEWPKKSARWRKIILEAVEQSGGTLIPELAPPLSLDQLLKDDRTGFVLHTADALPLLSERLHADQPTVVRLLIGPEGGFDEMEYRRLTAAGWQGASLGPRTLRCETAALAACALAILAA